MEKYNANDITDGFKCLGMDLSVTNKNDDHESQRKLSITYSRPATSCSVSLFSFVFTQLY